MTPEDKARFIALWNTGLETAETRRLIQPRPKGGAYPRQKALAR